MTCRAIHSTFERVQLVRCGCAEGCGLLQKLSAWQTSSYGVEGQETRVAKYVPRAVRTQVPKPANGNWLSRKTAFTTMLSRSDSMLGIYSMEMKTAAISSWCAW